MSKADKITLAGFVAFMAVVLIVAFWPAPEVQITTPNQVFALSSEELDQLPRQAIQGDSKAAIRLADYYNFILGDAKTSIHWWEVAARQGDVDGQHGLAVMLMGQGDPADVELGRRWMETAARNGSRNAVWALEAASAPR